MDLRIRAQIAEADRLLNTLADDRDALYAALETMLAVYWGRGDGQEPEPDCIIAAKAALSKARGEAK